MGQKPLSKRLEQGFFRLNFANREYIEHLTASLLNVATPTPGNLAECKRSKTDETTPFLNKTTATQPRKV